VAFRESDPDPVDVVRSCPLPLVLLEIPSEKIVAASGAVAAVLGVGDGEVEGRGLEEFAEGAPSGALPLMQAGRLDGYETRRILRRDSQPQPVTLWIRAVEPGAQRRHALALLIPDADAPRDPLGAGESVAVLGSTDAHLVVDRISSDVESVFGASTRDAVGRSLFQLVEAGDVASLLSAAAYCAGEGTGASLTAAVTIGSAAAASCWIVVLPMLPAPSVAFALVRAPAEGGNALTSAGSMARLLQRFGEGLRGAATSRVTARSPAVPGIERLSGRELDVVTRLVQGDRVPTIARNLFLSQSTVRNHLSSAFAKLGVADQQELVHLLSGRGR
jgi:DNA-binding CsgD family transcriptional regulator